MPRLITDSPNARRFIPCHVYQGLAQVLCQVPRRPHVPLSGRLGVTCLLPGPDLAARCSDPWLASFGEASPGQRRLQGDHPFASHVRTWRFCPQQPPQSGFVPHGSRCSPVPRVPARVRRDAPPVRRASPPAACNSSSKSTLMARSSAGTTSASMRVPAFASAVGSSRGRARSSWERLSRRDRRSRRKPRAYHLVYRAPALCPSADELIAKLRGLSPRIRIDDSAGAARVLEVTIDDDGLHGKMAVTKDGAASGAREGGRRHVRRSRRCSRVCSHPSPRSCSDSARLCS